MRAMMINACLIVDWSLFRLQEEGSRRGWFLGILWILQSESYLEVAMIMQILPLLLIPLQLILNNALEEIMSWLFGELPIKNVGHMHTF